MAQLQHLHLGFFLSPDDLIYEHINHAQQDEADDDDGDGESGPFGPEWCRICFERYAEKVRADELEASLAFAQCFKELRTLTWGSFFGKQFNEVNQRRTNIWVFRKEGKIRVRRKPW